MLGVLPANTVESNQAKQIGKADPGSLERKGCKQMRYARLDMNVAVYGTKCVYRDANNDHIAKQGGSPPIMIIISCVSFILHQLHLQSQYLLL